jgi:two-component system, cell cycle sensor histidine kinase and response regulator CckA
LLRILDSIPDEYVLLAISDNGSGMDSETLSHLFKPFFTTKEMGEGIGLGLATINGMMTAALSARRLS